MSAHAAPEFSLLDPIPALDDILHRYTGVLASDFDGYRNHTYRVANFCAAQTSPDGAQVEKIAIAAAFHDLGIWTERTFDYLQPSVMLARIFLLESGRSQWIAEIEEMIQTHHKVTQYAAHPEWLVEPFRRADWIDVSKGLFRCGLPRGLIRRVLRRWPSAGFHKRLVQLELRHLRTHPWDPLPMFKL